MKIGTTHNNLPQYLNDLQKAEPFLLGIFCHQIPSSWKKLRNKQGVYLIQDPITHVPIYVGRSNGGNIEAGLADRIWDHVNGNTTPIRNLRAKRNDPHLAGTYLRDFTVRAIEVEQKTLRDLVKAYCIHELNPEANITKDRRSALLFAETSNLMGTTVA